MQSFNIFGTPEAQISVGAVAFFVPSNGLNANNISLLFFVILVNTNNRVSYRVCYESQ